MGQRHVPIVTAGAEILDDLLHGIHETDDILLSHMEGGFTNGRKQART